jgi:predicted transcriptional regulator
MPAFPVEESEEGPTQRRSKSEMVCDLMLAIAKGSNRPTRIMQRANLTWNALLVYLNLLAMNGLVRREEKGNVSTYHLTDKGKDTLQAYVTLRDRLGPLKLETTDIKVVAHSVRPPVGVSESPDKARLLEALKKRGFRLVPGSVKGKSGVEHEFAAVAKDKDGRLHGYLLVKKPEEKLVLGLFISQLDTGIKVHVAHLEDPDPGAAQRAKEYGIEFDKLEPDGLRPSGKF